METEELSRKLSSAGLEFLGIQAPTMTLPPDPLWMISACGEHDGALDEFFDFGQDDLIDAANAAWFKMANGIGVVGSGREFLLSINIASGHEWPVLRWARVRLGRVWDVMGAGTESGILGGPRGRPGFVMLSLRGNSALAGMTWEEEGQIAIRGISDLRRAKPIVRSVPRMAERGTLPPEEVEFLSLWMNAGQAEIPD
ncbi:MULTISPECIES: hypothetical protein [unclassified Streptomyces]|uniref:hypothetical protein n=1 Tax=unclassified Streptomyces TaxID=2593676 RepID=UPI00224CDA55|nr:MULTISPECIES: hypothetical protein [unclassified Streptomyces]MCX5327918.1 hypothetical protein [Streptomyces sp. NBC_00140]MCX5357407.1 hypothetical protein [Streptomyces sp. NBC_00124]